MRDLRAALLCVGQETTVYLDAEMDLPEGERLGIVVRALRQIDFDTIDGPATSARMSEQIRMAGIDLEAPDDSATGMPHSAGELLKRLRERLNAESPTRHAQINEALFALEQWVAEQVCKRGVVAGVLPDGTAFSQDEVLEYIIGMHGLGGLQDVEGKVRMAAAPLTSLEKRGLTGLSGLRSPDDSSAPPVSDETADEAAATEPMTATASIS